MSASDEGEDGVRDKELEELPEATGKLGPGPPNMMCAQNIGIGPLHVLQKQLMGKRKYNSTIFQDLDRRFVEFCNAEKEAQELQIRLVFCGDPGTGKTEAINLLVCPKRADKAIGPLYSSEGTCHKTVMLQVLRKSKEAPTRIQLQPLPSDVAINHVLQELQHMKDPHSLAYQDSDKIKVSQLNDQLARLQARSTRSSANIGLDGEISQFRRHPTESDGKLDIAQIFNGDSEFERLLRNCRMKNGTAPL